MKSSHLFFKVFLILSISCFCICYGFDDAAAADDSQNSIIEANGVSSTISTTTEVIDSNTTEAILLPAIEVNETESSLSTITESSVTMKAAAMETTTEKLDEGGIKMITLILCGVTVAYWFITLIVAFILCMKYMGTQKRQTLPPPPPGGKLSEREYEEFSEVPDEGNAIQRNSKIQGLRNKMGKITKRKKQAEGSQQQDDEFAI